MESKNKKQTRREFFKSAAKSALPILAGVILANVPIFSKATNPMSCEYACSGGCMNGCGGCASTCMGECTWTCQGTCEKFCVQSCDGSCKTNCYGTCKNQCVMLTR